MDREDPPVLTAELCDELLERWRRAGLPVATRLRPPLDGTSLSRRSEALGVRLSPEAIEWWGFHDGARVEPDDPLRAFARSITGGLDILSFDEAAELLTYWRGAARRAAEMTDPDLSDDSQFWYRDTFLPIFQSGGGHVALDCSLGQRARGSELFRISDEDAFDGLSSPIAAPLGSVVSWWIEAWDRGVLGWNAALPGFEYTGESVSGSTPWFLG